VKEKKKEGRCKIKVRWAASLIFFLALLRRPVAETGVFSTGTDIK